MSVDWKRKALETPKELRGKLLEEYLSTEASQECQELAQRGIKYFGSLWKEDPVKATNTFVNIMKEYKKTGIANWPKEMMNGEHV